MPVVDAPTLDSIPRIDICERLPMPAKLERWKLMPGVFLARSSILLIPCRSRLSCVIAETLIGTLLIDVSRRFAVTTMSPASGSSAVWLGATLAEDDEPADRAAASL